MRDYLISDKSVYHIISSSDNVELVRYDIGSSKNEKNVSIKSTINTGSKVYKIIKICDGAFANCARMETVTIPDDVEEIGKAAFLNCISLKSIVIPEKIEKLDDEVFKNCINLRTLRLKNNNLTHIGVSAFEGCVKLKNIIINNIKDLCLPYNLNTIGDKAFKNCISISKIEFLKDTTNPNNCNIGIEGFANCKKLQRIEGFNRVNKISEKMFYNCVALNGIDIEYITSIESKAFYNCKSLHFYKDVHFSSAIDLYYDCFEGCNNINLEDKYIQLYDNNYNNMNLSVDELRYLSYESTQGLKHGKITRILNIIFLSAVTLFSIISLVIQSAFCFSISVSAVGIALFTLGRTSENYNKKFLIFDEVTGCGTALFLCGIIGLFSVKSPSNTISYILFAIFSILFVAFVAFTFYVLFYEIIRANERYKILDKIKSKPFVIVFVTLFSIMQIVTALNDIRELFVHENNDISNICVLCNTHDDLVDININDIKICSECLEKVKSIENIS